MPATTRKGKAKSASSGDGDNPSETEAIEAADDRSGRARKPSKKQAEINEDKQTAVKRKLEAMQKEYKKLKQQAKKLKTSKAGSKTSESAGNASESSSESSSFSPESEEEDETVATTRKHQSAFQSRGIFTVQQPPRKSLRREGDPHSNSGAGGATHQRDTTPVRGRSLVRTSPQSLPTQEAAPGCTPPGRDRTPRRLSLPRHRTPQARCSPPPRDRTPACSSPPRERSRSRRGLSPPGQHHTLSRDTSLVRMRDHTPRPSRSSPPRHGRSPSRRSSPTVRDRSRSHRSPLRYSDRSSSSRHHSSPPHLRVRSPSRQSSPSRDRFRHGRSSSSSLSETSEMHERAHPNGRHQPSHLGAPPPALPAQAGQPPTGDLKDPPFLHGRTPTGKPKAGDYEAHVNKMIVRACHQYEVLIATEDAFPDLGTQDGWATQVWTDTCKRTQVFYKLTERVEKIITGRDSHARGGLRDKIRPHIAATYGFVTDGSERAKGANRERYRFLLDCDASKPEPVFHYKDVESRSGFAHNVLILRALQDHWFADGTSPGIKYASQFSPIREVTLALVFTTIQFCLDQWADGTFNKHHMYTEKAYKSQYDMHLRHIRDWCAMDVNASRTVRQRLYDRARRASGAAPVTAPCPGLSDSSKERLRAELAAQAAACDSDAEENA